MTNNNSKEHHVVPDPEGGWNVERSRGKKNYSAL